MEASAECQRARASIGERSLPLLNKKIKYSHLMAHRSAVLLSPSPIKKPQLILFESHLVELVPLS